MKRKITVIDGNSLLFRAYYATAYGDSSAIMRSKDGTPTNAIFAFANMLSKILQGFKDDEAIFVGFDADKDTFRKEEFKDYKANRQPAPEDLKRQFPISRELLKALNIIAFEQHGVEADDICGTVAKLASKAGYEVVVYTSDRDYLQLIDDNIRISLLKKGLSDMEVLDGPGMLAKYGFTPLQIIDYKGLRGDDSDNLPGVPGVGDKTAVKLIQQYGSFEKIMAEAPNIPGKLGESLRANEGQARECYKLATIKTDVELPFTLDDLTYSGYDFKSVNDFAQKYELKQFLNRLPIALKRGGNEQKEAEFAEISDCGALSWPNEIGLALDLDFEEYHDDEPVGLALATKESTFYESWGDAKKDPGLKRLLADPSIKKDVYDGKATLYALQKAGLEIQGVSNDLLLAAYLLDSSVKSDPTLVYSSFGVDIAVREEEEVSLLSVGHPKTTGKMAFYALSLQEKARKSLESVDAYKLYSDIEMPLMFVLAKMELEGFPLHKEKLAEYGKVFSEKKDELQKEIYALAGHPFNLNSPKQIADTIYGEMKLGDPEASTSVDALEDLKGASPIVGKILEYRKYAKLMGTYIDGLAPHIKADGKIHSYFNQAQTSTGRLSSSSPNLQNISARDEEGKQIRNAFYYDDPSISLLSLDYGQIELRILAALSGCQAYLDVFNSDRDVHTETAKKIFHTEEVTPLMRRRAKAVNFAIIYGTTDFGLAQQIGGTRQEARDIIRSFYLTYPEVGTFLNKVTHDAETKGFVTTMFGRRRYLRDVNDPVYAKREAARRAALNAPVQGSAADLIKIAMVKIDEFLKQKGLKTKMVLQIHDELIFKVPDEELDAVKPQLAEIMTHCVTLPVKLTVEAGVGKNWFEAKD